MPITRAQGLANLNGRARVNVVNSNCAFTAIKSQIICSNRPIANISQRLSASHCSTFSVSLLEWKLTVFKAYVGFEVKRIHSRS